MRALRTCLPVLSFLAVACGDDPAEPRPEEWEAVALEAVPYAALGAGRVGFQRTGEEYGAYYLIDVAAETAYVYRGRGTSPALSPDGQRLAASGTASDFEEVWNLYVGDLGATDFTELHGPEGENDFDDSPAWTAGGDSLVYSVRLWGENAAAVRRRAANGAGEIENLAYVAFGEVYSRVSITSTPWLLAMGRPGAAGIWTLYPGSSPARIIRTEDVPSAAPFSNDLLAPAWSPDGTRLAFISHDWRSGVNRTELHLFEPATDSLSLLAVVSSNSVVEWGGYRDTRSVAWSPDGSRIAFTAYDAEVQSHLYVVGADGSGLTQVTTRPGVADFTVTWIP